MVKWVRVVAPGWLPCIVKALHWPVAWPVPRESARGNVVPVVFGLFSEDACKQNPYVDKQCKEYARRCLYGRLVVRSTYRRSGRYGCAARVVAF